MICNAEDCPSEDCNSLYSYSTDQLDRIILRHYAKLMEQGVKELEQTLDDQLEHMERLGLTNTQEDIQFGNYITNYEQFEQCTSMTDALLEFYRNKM